MNGISKTFIFISGIVWGAILVIFVNSTFAQINLEAEQEAYFAQKGEYISDSQNGINTYTTICKGYYVDDGNGHVEGYGDLADKYTYTYEKVFVASGTPRTITDILR